MKKFTKTGYAIEITLPGTDYIVRANILKTATPNTYDTTLELRRKDIGKWDMLDDEHYPLTSENINMDAYAFVMKKFFDGLFKRFIDRYEYELICFDRGNELFEMERLNDK